MESRIRLRMNGVVMEGWTTASVRKSLDQMADEFSLELTNQRIGVVGPPKLTGVTVVEVRTAADQITEFDECSIDVDGQTVITGRVDDVGFNYDANRAVLRVSGRSKTGDLCDASAMRYTPEQLRALRKDSETTVDAYTWERASLVQIASDLCAPFGITVLGTGVDVSKPFRRFKIEPGETVFEAISRAAAIRKVLPITNEDGEIDFVRAATISSSAVLELGKNVLAGGIERSIRGRFSEYLFRGQTYFDDDWSGKKSTQLQEEKKVEDPGVERYRPLLVLGDHQRSNEDLGARAIWERNVRAGRSVRHRYTVEEWYDSTKVYLWRLNTLVRIKDSWANVDADKLITGLEFVLDEERVTHIDLVDRAAFDAERVVKLPLLDVGDIVVAS